MDEGRPTKGPPPRVPRIHFDASKQRGVDGPTIDRVAGCSHGTCLQSARRPGRCGTRGSVWRPAAQDREPVDHGVLWYGGFQVGLWLPRVSPSAAELVWLALTTREPETEAERAEVDATVTSLQDINP